MNVPAIPEPEKTLAKNELIKAASNFLRGNILRDLADTSTGSITEDSAQLTKFHGVYAQDDRDLRNQLRREGKEKAFSFMARVRVPGGEVSVEITETTSFLRGPSVLVAHGDISDRWWADWAGR